MEAAKQMTRTAAYADFNNCLMETTITQQQDANATV